MRINPFYLHGEEFTPVRKLLALHAMAGGVPLTEYTVTGNPVSFETNVAKPLSQCLLSFLPVQSGTGDPSPDNVRPITGWTGANAYLSDTGTDDPDKQTFSVTFPALGKNLFDKNAVKPDYIWWKGTNDRPYENGNASAKIPVKPGETYTLYKSDVSQNQVMYFDIDGVYISQDLTYWGQTTSTNVIPDGVYYVAFNIMDVSLDTAIFVKGAVVGAYQPYTNTAYGGVLDMTTGVFGLTWLGVVVNENSQLYAGGASYNGQTGTNRFVILNDEIGAYTAGGISDMMKRVNHATWDNPDNEIWNFYVNANVQLHMVFDNETVGITSAMDASERTATIKTWLASNPVTFALPLRVPIGYQLTPQEIQTLIGTNVLWSDTNGDMTVKYLKKG